MAARTPVLDPVQFQDFLDVDPWRGFARSLLPVLVLFGLTALALTRVSWSAFLLWAVLAGLLYFNTLLLSHDAIHGTLTGHARYDRLFGRFVGSWGFWLHASYHELHLLHHRYNGHDPRDPERRQPTSQEYEAASSLRRFAYRGSWWLGPVVFGGFGMMWGLFRQARRFGRTNEAVARALRSDLWFVGVANAMYLAAAYRYGVLARYLVFFLVVERITGALNQLRSHVEHRGLWRSHPAGRLATYAVNSRNLNLPEWQSIFFNRLNFHSVHHVFPAIPTHRLKEAHRRMEQALEPHGITLPQERSFGDVLRSFAARFSPIGSVVGGPLA